MRNRRLLQVEVDSENVLGFREVLSLPGCFTAPSTESDLSSL